MLSKKNILTTSVVAATLLLSGCGSSSSSDDASTTEQIVQNFKGDLSLSGKVEVGNLAKSISFKTNVRKAESASSDEIVKLYVINEDGDMEDTNITCPVDPTTHEYSCEHIAGDQEYIVRYMKNLGDGKVYEMKTSVTVENEPVTDGKINKITTLIAQAITDAVEQGLASVKDVDQKTIKTLMVKIKQSITASVSNLIEKGLIQVPDDSELVVKLDDGKTFDDFVGSTTEDNNKLSQASGIIVSDDNVSKVLDSSKNEAKLQNYASMSKEELIKEIFNETGDGDVPEWVVKFLADSYDKTFTVSDLDKKIKFSVEDEEELNWISKDLDNMGVGSLDVKTVVNGIVKKINDNIASGDMFDSFKEEFATYKQALKDNNVDVLANFPPISGYLFDNVDVTKDTKFNVGQALVYILFAEDVYAKKVQENYLNELKVDSMVVDMFSNRYIFGFDPKFLFQDLGLTPEIVKAKYDMPEVEWFSVSKDIAWNDDEQKEVEFTTFDLAVSKASWMFDENFKFDKTKLESVKITYPKADSSKVTKDVTSLLSEDNVHQWEGGFDIEYNPWSSCDKDSSTNCTNKDMMNITDNVSGDYTIEVVYGGETFKTTKYQFVVNDASSLKPELTTPLAMPEWPKELNNVKDWTNLTQKQQELQKAFDKANEEYMKATGGKGYTTFALKDGQESVKDIIIKWDDSKLKDKIKELKLPKNIVPAYQVGVSLYEPDIDGDGSVTNEERNQCMMNWNKCNTEIFNTWWQEKPIMANSLMLPIELKENSGEGRYQVHVDLVFIDKNSAEEIAHGGNSYAEFKVGNAGELTGNEFITFKGHIATSSNDTKLPATIKVGFMKDKYIYDQDSEEFYSVSDVVKLATIDSNGNYEVTVKAKDIQQGLVNANGGYSIIAFDDSVKPDGIWQQWTPKMGENENESVEPGFWPDNTWIDFENQGDFRIGINREGDYTSFIFPKDQNITINDINITVWKYYGDVEQQEEDTNNTK